jgi:protein gp37
MANRLRGRAGYPKDDPFRPTFHPDKSKQILKLKGGERVFLDSMGDWFSRGVSVEWVERVVNTIHRHNDICKALHRPCSQFFVLTKRPQEYHMMLRYPSSRPSNLWIGASVTSRSDYDRIRQIKKIMPPRFISFEPLLDQIVLNRSERSLVGIGWVIIGAETGNRKGRIVPKEEWIVELMESARKAGIPVWMKNNLKSYWSGELIQEDPGA